MGREVLLGQPLPPDFTILVFGDTLLQQASASCPVARGLCSDARASHAKPRRVRRIVSKAPEIGSVIPPCWTQAEYRDAPGGWGGGNGG